MIAQMADRCYLEKCRDRLYPEFVLGGVALPMAANGGRDVRYASGLDLLRQTPGFMEDVRRKRLDAAFDSAYRYVEPLFDGRNPYIESIDQQPGLPAPGAAQRELAHAAAQPAGVRGRAGFADQRARPDERLLQARPGRREVAAPAAARPRSPRSARQISGKPRAHRLRRVELRVGQRRAQHVERERCQRLLAPPAHSSGARAPAARRRGPSA